MALNATNRFKESFPTADQIRIRIRSVIFFVGFLRLPRFDLEPTVDALTDKLLAFPLQFQRGFAATLEVLYEELMVTSGEFDFSGLCLMGVNSVDIYDFLTVDEQAGPVVGSEMESDFRGGVESDVGFESQGVVVVTS